MGPPSPAMEMMLAAAKLPGTSDDVFGPLAASADYHQLQRLTPSPFLSSVHGDRWVDVYANSVGANAYLAGAPIPAGTVVVKVAVSGREASRRPQGPVFVMSKLAAGAATDRGDWSFAVYWAAPPPAIARMLGGSVYWRGASPRVAYCTDCHASYDRGLGGLTPSSLLPR